MAVKDKLISNEVLKAVNDNMQGQVTDLKSAFKTLPDYDEYDSAYKTDGYIDAQGNVITVTPGWYISDYMPVSYGGLYIYSGLNNVGFSPSSAFYTSDKMLLSVFKQATGENALLIPENASFVRFSINADDVTTFSFKTQIVPSFDDVAELKTDFDNKLAQITEYIRSSNWFDKEHAVLGTLNSTPVLFSPIVRVSEGMKFFLSYHLSTPSVLSPTQFYTIQYFDANEALTGNAGYWVQGSVIPANVAYVKFVVAQTTAQYIMVEEGTQTLQWEAYFAPYYSANDEFARNEIDELKETAVTSSEEWQIPEKIYGVVGHELNIYYENAIKNGTMETIAQCDIGGTLANVKRYRDRLIWQPTASGTTAETLNLYKSDLKTVTKSANTSFVAAPANAGSGTVKVLVIGDSKTQYGQPTGYLQDIFENDAMTLELLGTRWGNNSTDQDTTNRHEGRGGWGAYTYCNAQTGGGHVNPFYNPDYTNPTYGGHFDFAYYMTNQGYSGVDYVFINLGTNDFGGTPYTYFMSMMAIIDSIRQYNENTIIVPVLVEGVYFDKLEWNTRNAEFFNFRQRLLGATLPEKTILNPMYLSMDLHNDFPFTSVPLSHADEFVNDGKTRQYCEDGIHQNPAGFYKNAFSMYAIIKCHKANMI